MNESRRHQVSLRGASAKEITRDALLERVNQERELRNYTRRANAAVLLIQRVWRRHYEMKSVALGLRQEWEIMMNNRAGALSVLKISSEILRPFLFFINYLSVRCGKIGATERDCMMSCFRVVLENIASKDVHQNFCSMATGSIEERRIWFHQSKKLISVCLFILSVFDYSQQRVQDVVLTLTAMRLSVLLTDPKGWNCTADGDRKDANTAVKNLISKEKILKEISEMDQLEIMSRKMPHIGWALANTVYLVTGSDMSVDSGKFAEDLDYSSYLHVVIFLADNLLASLENIRQITRKNEEIQVGNDTSAESAFDLAETTCGFLQLSYMDLFRPVYQQWHLKTLLVFAKDASICGTDNLPSGNQDYSRKYGLLGVAYYYSCMLRLFSTLNPVLKSLPVLNMLSFTPGFLASLWGELEKSLFHRKNHIANSTSLYANTICGDKSEGVSEQRQKKFSKDTGNKWVNVLQKFTGKSPTENDCINSVDGQSNFNKTEEHPSDEWDIIEPLRRGPEGISKDIHCLLLLFCSSYSHLLLVLDDIEFYDKQVPFTLEQQQKIASMLNTLVYNSLSRGISPEYRALVDSAVRCLHLLYERDCRRQFCHSSLWLSPGKSNRMPIAVAARTHEVFQLQMEHSPQAWVPSLLLCRIVKMFREFISMDKVSRRLAGEGTGPGSRSIEIVIRRGHIFEDGLRQLNSLGSRLKSAIHVSFVSESGLPEAGLDYGGLSKEFLTDISKAAFSPEYGLFSQTSTSDRLLIPNTTARFLDNGIQMIEFLGRIVGKALYEGILLDFYFSHVFVQKLLGRYSFLDELSTLDPELYRNLMYVKILPFSNAFYRGLTDLISPSWLKLFNSSEFNQLLSGGDHDIDVDDLRKNTQYTGGYSEGSRTVKLFWEVRAALELSDPCNGYSFRHTNVTSTLRAKLLYAINSNAGFELS
ncbi:hypothetical protein DH2020_039937 [Rehmannia glutinosa]|uniref:HECT-type E3 ubiquitin transferase n=1 Tax=Rehmannia glutinosa TaxID=99300 RepID=A0ABR0UVG1_REHGL